MKACFVFSGAERFPTCHAPVICALPGGDLLAAWYAGSREGAPDSVIMGARWDAGEKAWRPASVWVDVVGHAAGNPRLFLGPDGAIWLIAPINYGPGWCHGGTRLFLKRSCDGGVTWSDLELLLEEKGVLGKNQPLHIEPSTWIIPAEYERTWEITFLRSEDDGRTWQLVDLPSSGARLHQPTVVQLSDGQLLAYMRSWEGYIYETRSFDQGVTWTEARPTPLPNNNSGIDMVRLRDGRLVLALNPVALGPQGDLRLDRQRPELGGRRHSAEELCRADGAELGRLIEGRQVDAAQTWADDNPPWGPRTPLSLAISDDMGTTWRMAAELESGQGEFSYPAIIQDATGRIHIVYTHQRTSIKHVSLCEDELKA